MSNQSTIVQQFTLATTPEGRERLAPVCRITTPKEAREREARDKKRKAESLTAAPSPSSPPPSRKRTVGDNLAPVRQPDEEIIAEYRCPITQELPVDPVIAEDGQCYERCAIEGWFEKQDSGHSKSPMTNELMGKRLVPAVQARNAIERLISKGVIVGEAADAWTERHEELAGLDREWRATLANAYKGEVSSMSRIGLCYREGHHGFKKNQSKCVEWLGKAADRDDAKAVCNMAIFYLNGQQGVETDVTRGMFELARAAMLGSEHAAICAGNYFANGEKFVAGHNVTEAARWYKASKSNWEKRVGGVKDSLPAYRSKRDEWLKTHGFPDEEN